MAVFWMSLWTIAFVAFVGLGYMAGGPLGAIVFGSLALARTAKDLSK